MFQLTKERRNIYATEGWGYCLRCPSHTLEYDNIFVDGNKIYRPVRCNRCGLKWRDVFTLTDAIDPT